MGLKDFLINRLRDRSPASKPSSNSATDLSRRLDVLWAALETVDTAATAAALPDAIETGGQAPRKLLWAQQKTLVAALLGQPSETVARLEAVRARAWDPHPALAAAIMAVHDVGTGTSAPERIDAGLAAYRSEYLKTLHIIAQEGRDLERLGAVAALVLVRHVDTKVIEQHIHRLVHVLLRSGRAVEALDAAAPFVADGRADPNLHRDAVRAAYSIGRYAYAQDLLAQLKETYPADTFFALLAKLGDRVVGEAHARWMGDHVASNAVPREDILQAIPILAKHGVIDADVIARIDAANLHAAERLELMLALSEARQFDVLAHAELGRNWADLEAETAEQARLFAAFAADAPPVERAIFERQAALISEDAPGLFLTETAYTEALDLARRLNARIAAGRPTSFVRIGDGEASFLAPIDGEAVSDEVIRAQRCKMLSIWWGAAAPDLSLAVPLEQMIRDAVRDADVIGLVPPWRLFEATRYKPEQKADHVLLFQHALDQIAALRAGVPGDVVYTSAHANQALTKWGLLPELLRGVTEVSVVGPHDISTELLTGLGISVRTHHVTPPEHKFALRFGESNIAERMYPDAMERVLGALEVQPGEVVLVAAGFVGKRLCQEIKARGGIGLDMGSVADHLKGHETRVYAHAEWPVDLRPHTFRDRDFPLPAFRAGTGGPDEPCFSDASGTHDVLPLLPAGHFADLPVQDMSSRLVVTGHPRCASGFVAGFLGACDIRLGHERYARDGICSWMLACGDCSAPWGAPRHPEEHHPHVLIYARRPEAAVASIALENCRSRSFRFRRFNIMRGCGVDIAAFETPLARAVASYVYWYRLAQGRRPGGIIRVEHMAEDVASLAPVFEAVFGRFDAARIGAVDVSALKRNASRGKFTVEKPRFHSSDWDRLPTALAADLDAARGALGYGEGI